MKRRKERQGIKSKSRVERSARTLSRSQSVSRKQASGDGGVGDRLQPNAGVPGREMRAEQRWQPLSSRIERRGDALQRGSVRSAKGRAQAAAAGAERQEARRAQESDQNSCSHSLTPYTLPFTLACSSRLCCAPAPTCRFDALLLSSLFIRPLSHSPESVAS